MTGRTQVRVFVCLYCKQQFFKIKKGERHQETCPRKPFASKPERLLKGEQ